MNDPHVEAIHYRFLSEDPDDTFDKAVPLTTKLGRFDVDLKNQVLTARPSDHYANDSDARRDLEPLLKAWEQTAILNPPRCRIRFKFDHSEVVDRKPTPGVIHLSGSIIAVSSLKATLTRGFSSYPDPNPAYVPSPLTDRLTTRFTEYLDGRERISSMAYGVVSELVAQFGTGHSGKKRHKAARELQVSVRALDKLANLATDVDDPKRGRKAGGMQARSLTQAEVQWMEQVVARLIKRVGEYNKDPKSLNPLGMGDFPPL